MKTLWTALIMLSIGTSAFGQDWKDIPVPADPGEGMTWQLQEHVSDDFNYEAPADDKGETYYSKWTDFYHNHWTGPGLTIWDREHIEVRDGKLRLFASRVPGSNKVHLGCMTSKHRVKYPVYVEARAKIANSTLASDVWMLSPDDTQEIDIIEAYGATYGEMADEDQTWFAERIHISHHVFIREPFLDYQPKDEGTWYRDGTIWHKEYVRVGMFWRDPWHLEYYVNGKLVRTTHGKDIIDPRGYTNGTGLSKEMDIIINMEDQSWRSARKLTPTDNELQNKEDHTFKVDWIRVYKPVKESQ